MLWMRSVSQLPVLPKAEFVPCKLIRTTSSPTASATRGGGGGEGCGIGGESRYVVVDRVPAVRCAGAAGDQVGCVYIGVGRDGDRSVGAGSHTVFFVLKFYAAGFKFLGKEGIELAGEVEVDGFGKAIKRPPLS